MAEWWVRPGTSHSGTRNGTAYANAWGSWSEIVWGVGGVVGGDTLYVCGAHSYAAVISVGAHGGSSEATRCTIRGDYSADPGSITFTTDGDYLQNDRAWTRVTGLTINASTTGATNNNCIFMTDTATNCKYDNNVLVGGGTSTCIALYGIGGQDHSDIEISDNDMSNGGGTSGGAVSWAVSATAALSTVTRLSILRNHFHGISNNSDQVIHLRAENDTDLGCGVFGLRIEGNIFEDCKGIALRIGSDHNVVGTSGTLSVKNNTFRRIAYSDAGVGAAMAPRGFTGGEISGNVIDGVAGAGGGIDLFYCTSLKVFDNDISNLSTLTIDANGILFDYGNDSCSAFSNRIRNVPGKDGVFNSGVGLMVLDSTNIAVHGNLVVGCKWGAHIGAPGAGQSCQIVNNTFVDCADGGIYISSTATLANCSLKNNVFIGEGISVDDRTAVSWSAEDYNIFYGFPSGTNNHTLGANSSTEAPLLDSSYRPLPGSPCIGAGVYIAGAKHMGGMPMNASSPDIGAYRYHPERRLVLARAI